MTAPFPTPEQFAQAHAAQYAWPPIPGFPGYPPPGAPPLPHGGPHVHVGPYLASPTMAVAAAAAAEAAQARRKNLLPLQGNTDKANMDDRLFQNIQDSNFFKTLFEYHTFEEVVEKAEDCVRYINAWGDQAASQKRGSHFIVAAASGAAHLAGMRGWVHQHHQPSPAWCILFKLHTLRLSKDQIETLLGHPNPCLRCLALIYLRLMLPPGLLWDYFEDLVTDHEELVMTDKPNLRHCKVSEVAVNLILEMKYLDTRFPRIAETHMRVLRAHLSKKGIDAGPSDVGLVAQRERPGGKRDGERDERGPPKRRSTRPDLDGSEERGRPARAEEVREERPRKRSTRVDLEDEPGRPARRAGPERREDPPPRRHRDRDREDKGRDYDRPRDRDEGDRRADARRAPQPRPRSRSPTPEEAPKARADHVTATLAKLRSVYGAEGDAAGGPVAGDARAAALRKNYLASEKLTLGARAWGP